MTTLQSSHPTVTDDTILDCGHKPSPHSAFSTGYGYGNNGKTFCFACAALIDADYMLSHGRICLYLSNGEVTNWPGTLRYPVLRSTRSNHNMAGIGGRTDVWFTGPNGTHWHGYQIGQNNQICHCRLLKYRG